ncbi:MAG: thioredoxin family protein [Flavobacteriales bacterium]|nr:thioredoxin family protein [Flavobacteriales bacterium]MBO98100.1 thioredoxin family protein [Flavobacteriales bacterium]|tara:strand:+ start:419 stop:883 length:465 start_codon:yes stop_codon:yes gene_type:complete
MKKILAIILIALSFNAFSQENKLTWHTNVDKAIKLSVKEKKPLFFFFTGSDWCGWCIRLQKEVFFKPEFKSWASKNLILVELDFPKRKKLEPELQKQNQQLAQMFQVRGYPSGWFVIPEISEGKTNFNRLGSQGYVRGGVNAWIEGAKNILNKK